VTSNELSRDTAGLADPTGPDEAPRAEWRFISSFKPCAIGSKD
jgi:hypothetical protein